MSLSAKLLWEILVPTCWNTKKPIRTRHHKEWDKRVRLISRGMTILHPAKGHWISPEGVLHEERMIPVRLWCTKAEIEKIMDMTANHYKQEAVMAYCVASDVMVKNYLTPDAKKPKTKREPSILAQARSLVAKMGQYSELYIVASRIKSDDDFMLSERHFSGPEVDWTDHLPITRKQAVAIKKAGICDDWFNCIKEAHR